MLSRRLIALASLLLAATAAVSTGAEEVRGACAEVFTGEVCTWALMKGPDLVEAGATIPLATIEGAPAEASMTWPPKPVASIDLPDGVKKLTPLRQLIINWEPGGHPPAAFLTPHFDFHFYAITPAEIAAIDCKDERKPPALPRAYGLPDIPLPEHMAHMMGVPSLIGLCVPNMGMHAIPEVEIARAGAFEGTMVVGYYGGRPIFVEPMIAKATLLKKASFDLPIPAVPGAARFPATFQARWDAARREYRFTLSGFAPRG